MERPARARNWGLACGRIPAGALNSIADVPGVRVGHRRHAGAHGGNLYRERTAVAVHVPNGLAESAGPMQAEEMGVLDALLAARPITDPNGHCRPSLVDVLEPILRKEQTS